MAIVSPYTPIKDLKPFKTSWRIQAKILHTWNHYTQGAGMSFEMVLVDADGNKIQARIKKEHLQKFQREIKKGEWRIFDEFSVKKATGMYRPTTHNYRIVFEYSTVISPSETISESIWLDLVPFNLVLSGTLDQNKLVDIIGQLVNVGEIQIVDVKGKPTKKIDFQLRDTDDNRLPCSLWGRFADQISKVSKDSIGGQVICLIRWAKLCHYKEIRSISNSFDASDLLINPVLTEVDDFRQMLPSDGLALTIMEPKPRFQPLKVREERSKQFPRKTIAELKASLEVEKVKLICTILSIDLDWSWKLADKVAEAGFYAVVPDVFHGDPYNPENQSRRWQSLCESWSSSSWTYPKRSPTRRGTDPAASHFLARISKETTCCTFHFDLPFFQKNSFLDRIQAHFVGTDIGFTQGGAAKEISVSGAKKIIWRCDKCNTNVSSVEARYWLHLDVMDNTGESKLMLFDSFVEQIIGIPACDLVDPTTEELDDPLPLPDVVKNIIGKTYQFALSVEQDNISRGNDEYKVSEVLTSQNLNHPALEPEVDYPVDLSSMSSSDQVLMLTNCSHKDDTTNTSLSTPSSKRKEDTSDGSDQNSTSKKQCTGIQSDVKDDGVIDLDTPEKNDQSTDVKVDGVIAVDNSKEHDQPNFIHKLDEAGQEAINKVSEAEQKKVLLKKIKIEKLEGQKGANVSDLHVHSTTWRIYVKIMCMWEEDLGSAGSETIMMLADEKGGRIDARIPSGTYLWNFRPVLKEGFWFHLSDFQVIQPENRIRYSPSLFEIRFISETGMWPVKQRSWSNFFEFVFPIEVQYAMKSNKEIVTDAIGVIDGVNTDRRFPYVYPRGGSDNESRFVAFKIKDNMGGIIECIAVGTCCDLFMTNWSAKVDSVTYNYEPIVAVLRNWRITEFDGRNVLMSEFGCSRLYLDPTFYDLDIPQYVCFFTAGNKETASSDNDNVSDEEGSHIFMRKKKEARGQIDPHVTQTPVRIRPTSTVIDENNVPGSGESNVSNNVAVNSVFRRVLGDISNSPRNTSGQSPSDQRTPLSSTAIDNLNQRSTPYHNRNAKRPRNISPISYNGNSSDTDEDADFSNYEASSQGDYEDNNQEDFFFSSEEDYSSNASSDEDDRVDDVSQITDDIIYQAKDKFDILTMFEKAFGKPNPLPTNRQNRKSDHFLTKGRGPKMFAIQGENYHLIGALKPKAGDYPKFQQLYIVDTENEVDNRYNIMSKGKESENDQGKNRFKKEIIDSIIKLLDQVNPHVQAFRTARDRFNTNAEEPFHMRIIAAHTGDGMNYNMPSASEVAALIPGDFDENMDKRDIVLQKTSGKLKRISELHKSYLALQYPLLFARGENGYTLGIKKAKTNGRGSDKEQKDVSMRQWFAYRLQERKHEKHVLLRSKRLLQQFIVDAYTMIESNRLRYIKKNQPKFQSSNLESIQNASNAGNNDLENQERNLKPDDRPDIISRIFKMKLDNLMYDLTTKKLLGKTVSAMYTIEFQKRGLPHAHILLFMHATSKFATAEDIDKVISAEIPDKVKKREPYEVVKDCMIHGPCGAGFPNSPCMVNGSIKYLFKYVHKGHDRVTFVVEPRDKDTANADSNPNPGKTTGTKGKDEVQDYFDCRYVSACEAMWRIFKFPIHHRTTPVVKLFFHEEGKQPIYYKKGVVHETFRDAVFALGLLDDDKEYIKGITDANFWCSAKYVRRLFVIMLLSDSLSKPEMVWETTWKILSEDIERRKRNEWKRPDLILSDEEKKEFCLQDIARLLTKNGTSLTRWRQMPQVSSEDVQKCNHFLLDERKYNRQYLQEKHAEWLSKVTSEKKKIYDEIMDAVNHDKGGVFFVYGFGGTGKTFLWKLLSAAIRSKGDISLNVASSGIAALLLDGGRTAHSRKDGRGWKSDTMAVASLVWDQMRGVDGGFRKSFSKSFKKSFSKSIMKYISKCDVRINKPFGGKVIVFGGDFRQVLPVINGAGREEIVFAALNSSYIWEHCKVLELTKNMRLLANISEHEKRNIEEFSKWILDVGDGKIAQPNDGIAQIDIPEEFLITQDHDPVDSIIQAVYGNNFMDENDPNFFQGRAILCPTNEDVNSINEHMLNMVNGEERINLSSDSIDPADTSSTNNEAYSPDFLNSIRVSGLPNHCLRLKIGCPVMLIRNMDPNKGLCNGTRLQITQMADTVIEARVITGNKVGKTVLIPRMLITPSDARLPFKMRRRQFPLSVAFAMTINKSQGQTLDNVGLYLPRPVFSHGQLYVAISRVTSKSGLKILITDKKGKPQTKTMNVVFKEVFQNLR
ncbi:Nucleic acid-binding OB-fold [Arabidopsis thaliana x Arabidopsis arenosa]|uniref:ATP-dependent DNA helicase n=1 Tax=Arabidopsis thaliana x Arabidopsis arenosa TaxID=1240361 RepID=A0A8T2AWD5_9BRAS|nr:Nucleic acid-binding OB-fold [Arabidopsis thaliana x Arabidopsis arenosa]